ncbi:MAG: LytTR family DNA-binding domain-containing protein [Oscillospiraceae bacterium]|nr:LytTR family DNA-binding domain-containing protein [Oscillospiraceae bacterium]
MNFAVVEDNMSEADQLKTFIEKYCTRQHISCNVTVFLSEKEMCSAFKPGMFDIVFLDIYLGQEKEQGISLGRELMSLDNNLNIVLCTASPDYAVAGFQINATHYILKPITEEDVSIALSRLSATMERDARIITVSVKRKKTDIYLKDIVYAEVIRNQTIIHTTDGEPLIINQTLCSFEEELRNSDAGMNDCFIRCHKSFLVNMHHVTGTDEHGDFIMSTGENVFVRVKNGKTAKRHLHDFRIALTNVTENLIVEKG